MEWIAFQSQTSFFLVVRHDPDFLLRIWANRLLSQTSFFLVVRRDHVTPDDKQSAATSRRPLSFWS